MKKSIIIVFTAFCLLFAACEKDDYETNLSNGKIITQEIEIDNFTGITIDTKANVILRKGDVQKVTISISENILKDINIKIVNNRWLIDFSDGDNIATINNHEFTVTIESSNINYIEMESSGSFTCEEKITAPVLEVKQMSSGKTNIWCDTEVLKTTLDGSGELILSGYTNNHTLIHDASGSLKAFDLESNICNIIHEGSGEAKLAISSKFSGSMDGSGNVYYKGNPQVLVSVSGSGELIKSN